MVVILVLVGACGRSVGSEAVVTGASASTDSYIAALAGGDFWGYAQVSLGPGAMFFGGAQLTQGSAEARIYDEGVLVDGDGAVEPVPSMEGDAPLAQLSGARAGDEVYVIGTTCRSNRGIQDDGTMGCLPGGLELRSLDLKERAWSERRLPDDLVADGAGNLGVELFGSGKQLAIQLIFGDRSSLWLSDDGSKWRRGPALPGATVCSTGSSIIASVQKSSVPSSETVDPDTVGNLTVDLLQLRSGSGEDTWDPLASPPSLEVTALGASVVCAKDTVVLMAAGRANEPRAFIAVNVRSGSWRTATLQRDIGADLIPTAGANEGTVVLSAARRRVALLDVGSLQVTQTSTIAPDDTETAIPVGAGVAAILAPVDGRGSLLVVKAER